MGATRAYEYFKQKQSGTLFVPDGREKAIGRCKRNADSSAAQGYLPIMGGCPFLFLRFFRLFYNLLLHFAEV